VHGPVAAAPADAAAADFLARSPGARAEALLGLQSTTLPDLATRDRRAKESLVRVERDPGLVTPAWTLYALDAREVEFWQGDRDRRHTRLVYRRGAGGPGGAGWDKDLLWP
jgi:pyridoxamine 5'-phosphate oxidase